MTENKILERWTLLGLMGNIEANKNLKLALLYEDAVDILANDSKRTKIYYSFYKIGDMFETISFPIIYRVVKAIDAEKNISISDIFDVIEKNYDTICAINNAAPAFAILDTEMKITESVSNLIIETIKNKTV